MFVSVTRLRLRSFRFLPGFFRHAGASTRQLRDSPGFEGGYLARQGFLTYWTITMWADAEAMRRYRAEAAHLAAMPKLLHWCDEAAIAHWTQESAGLPTLEEARSRLAGEGRLSKVLHPSAAHAAGEVQPSPAPLKLGLHVAAVSHAAA